MRQTLHSFLVPWVVSLVVLCQPLAAEDKLVIRSAIYGDLPDGGKFDVFNRVSKLVKDGALRLEVSNDLFDDPAPNVGKKLVVKYELGGKELEATTVEGETLLLPQPKLEGELTILTARYGDLPNGDSYDVLSLVKDQLKNSRVEIAVDNDMFGDPAPGVFKRLRIEYKFGEVKLAKSVYEGGKLIIELPRKDEKKNAEGAKNAGPAKP